MAWHAKSQIAKTRHHYFELLKSRFGENAGASSHRANQMINFLSQKVKLLQNDLSWPVNSPDLNAIEILWAIIKSRLDATNITDRVQLFKEIERIWNEIPIKTINLLIKSFYVRLHTCLRFNGESLNGKKKFMKNFSISFEKGNQFIEKKKRK